MRSSRIAIAILLTLLVAAFAVPGAIACDKTKAAKAETASTANCDPAKCDKAGCDPASCPKAAAAASAETASATTAQAGSCASKKAETASATTAQAGGCASKKAETASATTAQAGSCASKAAATKTAGMGCSSSQTSAAKYDMAIETVKMPSGALAVIYTGKNADTVAMLQSAANGSAADFGCPNVQKMVASENCTVEMASTDEGLIFLCTSDDVALIDSFQKNYEVAMVAPVEEAEGE